MKTLLTSVCINQQGAGHIEPLKKRLYLESKNRIKLLFLKDFIV